jgi:aspartate kinase
MSQVFKFGGASIETPERARNVGKIIQSHLHESLVVVISAKGKTTNALELITRFFYDGDQRGSQELFEQLEKEHLQYARELLGSEDVALEEQLKSFFTEMDWVLNEKPNKSFDYYYDQIVCMGELLSTAIMAAYLRKQGMKVQWLDIRDSIKTDDTYRDANIDWGWTSTLVKNHFQPASGSIILTQGFIGSTDENNSVTLGREGSDYTAAVLANLLDADALTIWKDVPSLLNADPKIFPNTVPIEEISFHEVIEMSYYGAQVIHPKTIKPLHNKNIPLYVRCFLAPEKKGTKIHQPKHPIEYPPLMVLKPKQILLQVTTRDFSFITEDNLSRIYELFHRCKIKINLIQNAAISFVACIDNQEEKLEKLLQALQEEYEVRRNEDLFLFTVRHYTEHVLQEELKNRTVLLTQKTRSTIQMVVR